MPTLYDEFISEIYREKGKCINHFIREYKKKQVVLPFDVVEDFYINTLSKVITRHNTGKFTVTTLKEAFNYFYGSMNNAVLHHLNTNIKFATRQEEANQQYYSIHYSTEPDTADNIYKLINDAVFWDNITNFLLTKYSIKQVNMFKAKFKSAVEVNPTRTQPAFRKPISQKQIAKDYGKSQATISVTIKRMIQDIQTEFIDELRGMLNEY